MPRDEATSATKLISPEERRAASLAFHRSHFTGRNHTPYTTALASELYSRAEAAVAKKMEADGWKVIHNGWPDFLCVRGREVQFIEVKGKNDKLRRNQVYVLRVLRAMGLNVRVVRPRRRPK